MAATRLAELSARQKKEMGEAQNATLARDKKLDELSSHISDLRAVAKVALQSTPSSLKNWGFWPGVKEARPGRSRWNNVIRHAKRAVSK